MTSPNAGRSIRRSVSKAGSGGGGMMVSELARNLRKNATDAERKLWRHLRLAKREGVHFRRQAPIGPYVADFACHRAKIVVELDGSQHSKHENMTYDAARTAYLESRGYRVLRF